MTKSIKLPNSRFFYIPIKDEVALSSCLGKLKKFVLTHKDLSLAGDDIVIEWRDNSCNVGVLVIGPPSKLSLEGAEYLDWGGESVERHILTNEKSMAIEGILMENCQIRQLEQLHQGLQNNICDFTRGKLHIKFLGAEAAKLEMELDIFN